MIAGEYSVLRPGGVALALAVRPGIELEVSPASALRLERADTGESWAPGQAVPAGLTFVHAALLSVPRLPPLRLCLWTPAEVGSGDAKPGFGGSASATVGALGVAWEAVEHPGSLDAFIAAAHDVHRTLQGGRGSGYDVATIAHGGATLWRVLETDATGVRSGRAEAVQLAPKMRFMAGYAGRSASTTRLVTRVAERLGAGLGAALDALGAPVPSLVSALESGDRAGLVEANLACRKALGAFDALVGGGLVTPELAALLAEADRLGVPCKVSGAGGGDSVVAFDSDPERLDALAAVWTAAGCRVLPLALSGGAFGGAPRETASSPHSEKNRMQLRD
jgi:phosphomevalonate kinase